MATLIKTLAVRNSLSQISKCFGAQSSKYLTTWNKDWKPGPYPKTEAERIAAAKKYGLSPEEYEPYPDDGTGYGDYPKLPLVSDDVKDPYYNYDYPELKRDFGELIHVDYDMYTAERLSTGKTKYSIAQMAAVFLGIIATSTALYVLGWMEPFVIKRPLAEKQYPKEGVVHYTFEIENE